MEQYFVHYGEDGRLTRIAKIVDGCLAYAYQDEIWVPLQGLIRIRYDVTADYDEISEEEAGTIISVLDNLSIQQ